MKELTAPKAEMARNNYTRLNEKNQGISCGPCPIINNCTDLCPVVIEYIEQDQDRED